MKTYNRLSDSRIRNAFRRELFTNEQLIYPIFIKEGTNIYSEIKSMPGQYHYSIDKLDIILEELKSVKVFKVLLFGVPNEKDENALRAYEENNIVNQAIKKIKSFDSNFYVICDVCLCEYTTHGHCQLFNQDKSVNIDLTRETLSNIALSYVKAGADMIAPSDMQDSRVKYIREKLDENNFNTPIMCYSVKYASNYYGPFREAANSAPSFKDRRDYQIEYESSMNVLSRVKDDLEMGSDIIIVKPASSYLDVIKEVKSTFNVPVAAYQVSGEYYMIKSLEESQQMDYEKILDEQLHAFKRCGVDILITYFAIEIARKNNESN